MAAAEAMSRLITGAVPSGPHDASRLTLLILLLVVVLPSAVMTIFGATSMALGIALTAVILISHGVIDLYFGTRMSRRRLARWILVTTGFVLVLTAQSLFASAYGDEQDTQRLFGGLALLVLIWGASGIFAERLSTCSDRSVDRLVTWGLWFLAVNAALGLSGVVVVAHASFKACGVFSEPSHLAMVSAPLLLYATARRLRRCELVLASFFMWGLLIQNLTMLVVVILAVLPLIRLRFKALLMLSVFVAMLMMVLGQSEPAMEYFRDRLVIDESTDNLSVLVLLRGWEYALQAIDISRGWGLGFQQFGVTYIGGDVLAKLQAQGLGDQNLLDGGTAAAKIVGELGYVGIFLLAWYVLFAAKCMCDMRRASGGETPHWRTFLRAGVVGVSIEMFVRGAGYFTPDFFILFTAISAAVIGLKRINT
ncbi:hypothetical protein [Ralstonia sp. UBA689]|uniref:hypothetical protein n=1 Tax=Ralstonia sp. UBA689 TaxID=1947373 RepID=UPI0025F73662|nr:hypothetical protein [Ralstonia sp. UBA689]